MADPMYVEYKSISIKPPRNSVSVECKKRNYIIQRPVTTTDPVPFQHNDRVVIKKQPLLSNSQVTPVGSPLNKTILKN